VGNGKFYFSIPGRSGGIRLRGAPVHEANGIFVKGTASFLLSMQGAVIPFKKSSVYRKKFAKNFLFEDDIGLDWE